MVSVYIAASAAECFLCSMSPFQSNSPYPETKAISVYICMMQLLLNITSYVGCPVPFLGFIAVFFLHCFCVQNYVYPCT